MPNMERMAEAMQDFWETRWLTNYGSYHNRLEARLSEYLGSPYTSLMSNGTLGLMIALKALCPPGSEVITTPYSFIATANAIEWCGLIPVFCDIDPRTFTLDPAQIEAHITPRTSAILPVHVYGFPCEVEAIADIATRHDLNVIYDAAHAFGVRYKGRPITEWGDASVLSFHATKLFNTVEGGAVCAASPELQHKVNLLRNFGITGETAIEAVGINAKLNEVLSLWGLLVLDEIEEELARRRAIDQTYREVLSDFPAITVPDFPDTTDWNYAYFPILVEEGGQRLRDRVYDRLLDRDIHSRKYFFPLITDVESYSLYRQSDTPVAKRVAENVLCLPMYGRLDPRVISVISDILRKTL